MAAHHDDDEEESEEDEDDGDYEDENDDALEGQDLTFAVRGVAHDRLMTQREPVKPVPRAKRSSGKRAKERRMTLLDDQSS